MQSLVAVEHQQLFDEMLDRFNLKAQAIAESAGVSSVMVSRFPKGKVDLTSSELIALLSKVPVEAQVWYVSQLLGSKPTISLRSLVDNASPQEKAEILNLIAST